MIFKKLLEIKIEIARRKMNRIWDERGYTDKDVLDASIELDNLLNQYQNILLQKSHISLINSQVDSSKIIRA